jgi:hypothetical protein
VLHQFIVAHHAEIIRRCRASGALRSPATVDGEDDRRVSLFLDQVAVVLRGDLRASPEMARLATAHGHDRVWRGLSAARIVHDYGDVRQAIADLAVHTGAAISAVDGRVLDDCVYLAIAVKADRQVLGAVVSNLLQNAFKSTDRTGLGLGLAFSRRGAEANHGRLTARNLPGKGCAFTLDLPRIAAVRASVAAPAHGLSLVGAPP